MRRLRNGGFAAVTATEAPGRRGGVRLDAPRARLPGAGPVPGAVALDDLPAGRRRRRPARCVAAVGALRRGGDVDGGICMTRVNSANYLSSSAPLVGREGGRSSSSGVTGAVGAASSAAGSSGAIHDGIAPSAAGSGAGRW